RKRGSRQALRHLRGGLIQARVASQANFEEAETIGLIFRNMTRPTRSDPRRPRLIIALTLSNATGPVARTSLAVVKQPRAPTDEQDGKCGGLRHRSGGRRVVRADVRQS